MKKILASLFLCLGGTHYAQSQHIVYHEDFESPGHTDSISVNNSFPTPGSAWDTTSAHSAPGNFSFSSKGTIGQTQYFETSPFSTQEYVILEFKHIAKMDTQCKTTLKVSTDNGVTWQIITVNQYRGEGSLFNNSFNKTSYREWSGIYPSTNRLWMKESFDLRGLASDTVSHSGYSQVKLRFELEIRSHVSSVDGNEWYIDDITVHSDGCNFAPMAVNWHIQPVPCFNNHPEEAIVRNSSEEYRIAAEIKAPPLSIDSARLFYKIHKADGTKSNLISTDMTEDMTGTRVGAILARGEDVFYADIVGAAANDTVNYYIKYFYSGADSCASGVTRTPLDSAEYYSFYVEEPLPGTCGTPNCSMNPELIQISQASPSWKEDFEGFRWVPGNNGQDNSTNGHRGKFPVFPDGAWVVSPSTDPANNSKFAWCVGNSATYTPGTGPDGNHTPGGSKYLFTEGSQGDIPPGDANVLSLIELPCIDLTENTEPLAFEFYYHMFGENGMRTLRIDIGTASSGFTGQPAWRMFGAQQNSSSDPWKRGVFSLAPFNGEIVRIRILGVKDQNTDKVDIAIDDLRIFRPASANVSVLDLLSPEAGHCGYTHMEPVKVVIQNSGIQNQQRIPLAYRLNNGAIVRDTAEIVLEFTDTASFTFDVGANLSAPGIHHIKVWPELNGDSDPSDDTLYYELEHNAVLNTLPFIEDFETSVPAVSLSDTGTLNSDNLKMNISQSNSKWMVYNGPVRDTMGGPLGGSHIKGNYLLFVGKADQEPYNKAEILISCVDLSEKSAPVLGFKYFKDSYTDLDVHIRERGTEVWSSLTPASWNNISSKSDEYKQKEFNLSSFSGKVAEIRITGGFTLSQGNPENPEPRYIAIDDIYIFEPSTTDFGLVSLDSPKFFFEAGKSVIDVDFTVIRHRAPPGVSGTGLLKMELRDLCNTSSVITGQSNSLNLGAPYQKSSSINLSAPVPGGWYECKLWLEANNDTTHWNDTIIKTIQVIPAYSIPYSTGFEDNCSTSFHTDGLFRDWQQAKPAKGDWTAAYSGNNCMVTHPEAMLASSEEVLYSPVFTGHDSLYQGTISFYHRFDFGSKGYGAIEYYDESTADWKNLTGTSAYNGINWFRSPYVKNVREYTHRLAFSGNSNGWIYSSYRLDAKVFEDKDSLQIRFVAKGTTVKGWAIDDFQITPAKKSVSPVQVLFADGPPLPSAGQSIVLQVKNTGTADISSFKVDISVNGSSHHSQSIVPTLPLPPDSTLRVPLNQAISFSAGSNMINVVTSSPNGKADQFPADDTLNVNAYIPVNSITDFPYCNDFETDQAFAAFDLMQQTFDTVWTYGSPQKSTISSAYSGENCWYTSSGLYGSVFNRYLSTPDFRISGGQCYKLSFKHFFDTEAYVDGANVEYSTDSGATWSILGTFDDPDWFNTEYVEALDLLSPGWTGSSNGWETARINLKFHDSVSVRFRFRFASDFERHYEGWAIDDFCLEELDSNCKTITLREIENNLGLHIFPNPVRDELNIVQSSGLSSLVVEIVDQRGMIVKTRQIEADKVKNSIRTGDLSPGIYIIRIMGSGQISQHRLVKY